MTVDLSRHIEHVATETITSPASKKRSCFLAGPWKFLVSITVISFVYFDGRLTPPTMKQLEFSKSTRRFCSACKTHSLIPRAQ